VRSLSHLFWWAKLFFYKRKGLFKKHAHSDKAHVTALHTAAPLLFFSGGCGNLSKQHKN
jgi:hypothetical protein